MKKKFYFLSMILILGIAILILGGCQDDSTTTNNGESESIYENNESNNSGGTEILPTEQNEYKADIIFSTEYKIHDCANGYFIASDENDRVYGLLDSNGKTIIDFTYDYIDFPDDTATYKFVCVNYDNKIGTIGFDGKILIPIEYDELNGFENGLTSIVGIKDKKTYILGIDGSVKSDKIVSEQDIHIENCNIENIENITVTDNLLYQIIQLHNNTNNSKKTIYRLMTYDGAIVSESEYEGKYTATGKGYSMNNDTALLTAMESDGAQKVTLAKKDGSIENITDSLGSIYISSIKKLNDSSVIICCPTLQKLFDFTNITFVNEDKTYNRIYDYYNGKAFANIAQMGMCIINTNGDILQELSGVNDTCQVFGSICVIRKADTDTYRMYSLDGSYNGEERYYNTYSKSDWLMLENVDTNCCLISPNGKKVIDFGNITETNFFGLNYNSNNICESNDMFSIIVSQNGINTVYGYYS